MTDIVGQAVDFVSKWFPAPRVPPVKEIETVVIREVKEMIPQGGRCFVRLAGLSGALAVGLGAYGAHVFRESEASPHLKLTFETGNRYHFFHTIALLAVPLAGRPRLTGSMMALGMVLFSGSCYCHALTGNDAVRKITPYGGMLLIAAWVSMML